MTRESAQPRRASRENKRRTEGSDPRDPATRPPESSMPTSPANLTTAEPRRFLVKTEPTDFAYGTLVRERRATWDGVRNALAQRHLGAMRKGDLVLVYHTGKEKSVAGLARVAAAPKPDPTDGSGKAVAVDLGPVAAAVNPVTLAAIKADPRCAELALVRMPRLSVMPVAETAWTAIVAAAGLPLDA